MFSEENINNASNADNRSASSNAGSTPSSAQGDFAQREYKPRREGGHFRDSNSRGPGGARRDGGFRPGGKKKSFFAKKVCKFTTNQIDPASIDYKNVDLLKRFVMPSGKITPRRITGTSSKYQRVLSREIKKARIMAFLPFSAR